MKVATKIKMLVNEPGRVQAVYRLDPPYADHKIVVVSGVHNMIAHEVMMFPSDGDKVTDFGDLSCLRGTTNHRKFFDEIGYVVSEG